MFLFFSFLSVCEGEWYCFWLSILYLIEMKQVGEKKTGEINIGHVSAMTNASSHIYNYMVDRMKCHAF